MSIVDSEIRLTSSGTDSGLAIDRIGDDLPPGNYILAFRLRSRAGGDGEVFFTVDEKTSLPRGEHLEFKVVHDGQWQEVKLALNATKSVTAPKSIKSLRLDVGSQPGEATIADLRLMDAAGTTLARWPSE